jgi:hypothetical protein
VDACTVTTPDAITAFAVPNPNCSSQSQSVFSGLAAYRVTPAGGSLGLLRIGNVLFSPTLSTIDGSQLKQLLQRCQRNFRLRSQITVDVIVENKGDSRAGSNSMERNQFHFLTPGNTSRIVVPANIRGCRISLLTWMAARWEIPDPRVLEW